MTCVTFSDAAGIEKDEKSFTREEGIGKKRKPKRVRDVEKGGKTESERK